MCDRESLAGRKIEEVSQSCARIVEGEENCRKGRESPAGVILGKKYIRRVVGHGRFKWYRSPEGKRDSQGSSVPRIVDQISMKGEVIEIPAISDIYF